MKVVILTVLMLVTSYAHAHNEDKDTTTESLIPPDFYNDIIRNSVQNNQLHAQIYLKFSTTLLRGRYAELKSAHLDDAPIWPTQFRINAKGPIYMDIKTGRVFMLTKPVQLIGVSKGFKPDKSEAYGVRFFRDPALSQDLKTLTLQ